MDSADLPVLGRVDEGEAVSDSDARYPVEVLDDDDDDGTMPANVEALREAVIGRRIVSVETDVEVPGRWYGTDKATIITLDDDRKVQLVGGSDCCAFTELEAFLLHPERVNNIILGVGTTDGYTTWHIFADMGDVLELTVGWSCGNPFYYGYGFDIKVLDLKEQIVEALGGIGDKP